MLQRHLGTAGAVVLGLALLAGCGGSGRPGHAGRHGHDDFDRSAVRTRIVRCAGEKHPSATVHVTVDADTGDRKFYVGVDFLDAGRHVVDSASLKLTPQNDDGDDEVSANVTIPMNEPEKAARVAHCRMKEAF